MRSRFHGTLRHRTDAIASAIDLNPGISATLPISTAKTASRLTIQRCFRCHISTSAPSSMTRSGGMRKNRSTA
jgi:hypothetical protein